MSNASRKLMQVQATAAPPVDTGDPYWKYVSLLLDGDGTSDDDNNTFTDSSTNGFTITKNGSVTQGSFSPNGDNWSNYLNGTDYLYGTVGALGTGDFTVECWVNFSSLGANRSILSFGDYSPALYYRNVSTELAVYHQANGGAFYLSGFTPEVGEWYHVAFTRSGTTSRMFVNGVQQGSNTTYSSNITNTTLRIGYDGVDYTDAYMSNVRVVKGTALYTSNFTAPTSPLSAVTNTEILTCQSNRFIDNGGNSITVSINSTPKVTPFSPFKDSDARTLTTDGGSGYFDGSGDYLTASDNAAFSFGTGDFTVEAWVYLTGGGGGLWSNGPTSSGSFGFYFQGTNELRCDYYGGTSLTGTTQVPDYAWHHVAVIRNGSTLSLYLNGAREATTTTSSNNTTDSFAVGRAWTNHAPGEMLGYISDLRVVKGTALYTGTSYTVPTAPLTAVTNTSALLNFQDAGIFDRSGINNLDTVGDARLGFAPIYGTGSLAFDGTGDYLSLEANSDLAFGTGDFTIEFWLNTNNAGVNQTLIDFRPASTNGLYPLIYIPSGSTEDIRYHVNGANRITSSTISSNAWMHVAVARSGSSTKLFIDGAQQGSTYADSNNYAVPSRVVIGAGSYSLGGAPLDGFMDDLRITKGVARYTSDFTPPTEIDLSTDTHAEYVTLFLDGDGTVNGQNNTFTDSSTNGFTVTESGSVVQGVFSPYGDNWSNYFNGSSTLQTASAGDTDFDFSTGEFTVECFVNFSSVGNNGFFGCYNTTGWYFQIYAGQLQFANGASAIIQENWSPSTGVWYHIACSRNSSGDVRLFVDGTQLGSAVNYTSSLPATYNLVVGSIGNFSRNFDGYLSSVRIVKGTAVYTSNFTAPTSPLTAITNTTFLSSQSNRFIDNSSSSNTISVGAGTPEVSRFSPFESDKPYDITTDGGSGYFNYGPYLTVPQNAAFNFGTGEFTVEFWVNVDTYRTSGSYYDAFVTFGHYTSSPYFRMGQDGKFKAGLVGIELSSTTVLSTAEWYHLAVTRSGTTVNLFVNGTLEATNTHSASLGNSAAVTVGTSSWQAANEEMKGYLSDVRIVKGSAVYTSSFTPPTAPLTAVTNTSALLNFQDSAIPDLSGLNNIDTIGNAKVDGTDPTKYGSNAMQFDGSGDCLASTESAKIGTGDFTLEAWIYPTTLNANDTVIAEHWSGTTAGFILRVHTNNYLSLFDGTTNRASSTAIVTNQWQHVAASRENGTLKLFINGTQVLSVATSSSLTGPGSGESVTVGAITTSSGFANYFTGYIDDVRITKGYARYTSNFTAPTAALKKF